MADQKELRRMSRTELIEIIYALQQHEQSLNREINELNEWLNDRTIRMESVGSIAEASLSLNHVFEEAQAAADEYLMSVRAAAEEPDPGSQTKDGHIADVVSDDEGQAADKAQRIIEEAQAEADRIIASAQLKAEEINKAWKRTLEVERDRLLREIIRLLEENPELAAALRERTRREKP